jgi:hypothetical protein
LKQAATISESIQHLQLCKVRDRKQRVTRNDAEARNPDPRFVFGFVLLRRKNSRFHGFGLHTVYQVMGVMFFFTFHHFHLAECSRCASSEFVKEEDGLKV